VVKLVLQAKTSPLSEIIQSFKCFPLTNKMKTLTHNLGPSWP